MKIFNNAPPTSMKSSTVPPHRLERPGASSHSQPHRLGQWIAKLLLLVLCCASWTSYAQAKQPDNLSAKDFAHLINDLSEEGGYFRSDNFTSNETSYLTVVDKLKQLGATGGAYLGVGPEQNFTYIAKIRPRIAFIIDIRRQAMIQHLMYKAIFHLSPNRVQFLSRLLSKPLLKEKVPAADAPINDLLNFFAQIPADDKTYEANLAQIRKTLQDEIPYTLSADDQKGLEYIYKSFRDEGLDIAYRVDSSWGGYFPTFREIIAETDLNNKQGNFLASVSDYDFVREMQRKNLIIPVVGDFGGKKAIAAVGEYLKKNNFTVTAFYTSNVEQYLFGSGVFEAFANNVKKLPLTDKSLFIRAVPTMRYQHPVQIPRYRITITLLQQMSIFLKDFDAGLYKSYQDLTTTNYISPDIK
ncbi:MAG: hypothetical protein HY231_17325 [Acidobacteria bacterium]|nr:hypothetical protein [Acidobacteriota bacterium]